jgi:hypothetical protein
MLECGTDLWRLTTSMGLAENEGHKALGWSNKQAREIRETGIVQRL